MTLFAHSGREKRLSEHLVRLVRAAVNEIFALQVERRLRAACEVAAFGERRRAARIVREEIREFRAEGRIVLRFDKGAFELIERRHERFRYELSAEAAEKWIEAHNGFPF